MRTVVLWRHGRTPWNAANRFQGHTDIHLDDEGRAQAAAAAAALAQFAPAAVVSSDLARALDTARALAAVTGHRVTTDPRLRETDAGAWEGRTHDEIRAADDEAFQRWLTDPAARPGGHGETPVEVGRRVAAAVREHAGALAGDGPLVVVTHGGAARAAVGELLGWPPSTWRTMSVMANCGWAELTVAEQRWHLRAYNRVHPVR